MKKCEILGIEFDDITMDEAVTRAMRYISDDRRHYIVTPNAEITYLCRNDEKARHAVNCADLILPDGVGVVDASKILGRPLAQRVAGIDFASELLPRLAESNKRLYLLGAKPGVAEEAAEKLRARYPGLNICGLHDGYFQDDAAMVAEVNAAEPEVLFVCMGAPRQEVFMYEQLAALRVGLMVGLGGSLDVFSGRLKRAPRMFINMNLEWLYRLLRQPTRLKRAIKLPLFLHAVRRQRREEKRGRRAIGG